MRFFMTETAPLRSIRGLACPTTKRAVRRDTPRRSGGMAFQVVALFDRLAAIDGVAKHASMRDRGRRGGTRVGDSSFCNRLNGTQSRGSSRGRCAAAATRRGLDGFDDHPRGREPFEYPFGRVQQERHSDATRRTRVVHQPNANRTARAASRDWERPHHHTKSTDDVLRADSWTDTGSSYPTEYASGYSNIVPVVHPNRGMTKPSGPRFRRSSVRRGSRAFQVSSVSPFAKKENQNQNQKKTQTVFAGVALAFVSFVFDVPGTIARVDREHKAHVTVSSCFVLETVDPSEKVNRSSSSSLTNFLTDTRPPRVAGHVRTKEAPRRQLRSLGGGGGQRGGKEVLLHHAAAKSFLKMSKHAARDGVTLTPVSGFRDVNRQSLLFFDGAGERGQTLTERAKVSAPPGFSEHHTGYAIDISSPEMGDDLTEVFEGSGAFAWLAKNAQAYDFEMSFPKNNDNGVSYEPWHWRYVGDRHSQRVFHEARGGAFGNGRGGVAGGRVV